MKMLEVLFPSRVRRKLLQKFFNNPDKEFYIRELAREINESFEPIRRELLNLERGGIITCIKRANVKYYTPNKAGLLYKELLALINKGTTSEAPGEISEIKEALATLWNIKYAFRYYPNKEESKNSEFHLIVVGKVSADALGYLFSSLERRIKAKIYFFLYNEREFEQLLEKGDEFLLSILSARRDILIGDEDGLKALLSRKARK